MMLEHIWILLLLLLIVLFNLITGFLNRRRPRDAAGGEKQGPQAGPPSRRAPPRIVVAPRRIDVSPPSLPVVHPRRRRGMKLQRDDLRRAIVLTTLLGPPRAFDDEPHDVKR